MFGILLLALPAALPQGVAAGSTLDEQVARDAARIAAAAEAWATDKDHRVKEYRSRDGRISIWSDFGGGATKSALKRASAMLERIDAALGAPPEPVEGEAAPLLRAVLLRRESAYHALCDALAAASPPQQEYFSGARNWTGFTVYAPELTVYYHDPGIQDEARADHNLGHNLAHLEVHRRYGVLPLWIAEGIATACEDGAWGEVWAPWNLQGFVYASSHASWRGEATQQVVEATSESDLELLWSYSAKPWSEQPARLAFAFATYGLDRDPVGFAAFLGRLQEAYATPDEYGKREDPDAESYRAWLVECFGESFGADLRAWWEKPPSWKSKPKPLQRP